MNDILRFGNWEKKIEGEGGNGSECGGGAKGCLVFVLWMIRKPCSEGKKCLISFTFLSPPFPMWSI